MNKEDKKLQKQLVDEMMKVSKTNPDVMIYMRTLMESYEKLEQENKELQNIIKEAREYVKNKWNCNFSEICKKDPQKLLEILDKGETKENKYEKRNKILHTRK